MPRSLSLSAIAGAAVALLGAYWDDAWHTERGRDSAFIAPHLLIYSGVAAVAALLAAHVLLVARRRGLRAVRENRPLVLACLGLLAAMASGPIDSAWHVAFGRDAVLWSPPHMLGIAGLLALAAALLVEVAGTPTHRALVGGLVLATALFPVAEYDTDVPQFATVWYLPALGLGTAVAFVLIRAASTVTFPRARAAAAQLLFLAGVSLFLLAQGFDAPGLTLVVVAAAAADLAERAALRPAARAGITAAALALAYVPVRTWLGHGVAFSVTDAIAGTALAWLAIVLVDVVAGIARPPARGGAAIVTAAAVLLTLPAIALAHDPGQGADAGTASLTVTARDGTLRIHGALRPCADIAGGTVTARRGGVAVSAPLTTRRCRFDGVVRARERGRWFVYADLETGRRTVETWLPIHVSDAADVARDPSRFAYEPRHRPSGTLKLTSGAVIYAIIAALLLAAMRLVRPPSGGPTARRTSVHGAQAGSGTRRC